MSTSILTSGDTRSNNSAENCSPGGFSVKHASIEERHWAEFTKESGIRDDLAALNFRSVEDKDEIKALLNWKNYHNDPGWVFQSADINREKGTRQKSSALVFKPNRPIAFNGETKARKYVVPSGKTPDILLFEHPDHDYWHKVAFNHQPVIITEGIKKALAAHTATSMPAIALSGVTNWSKPRKPDADKKAPRELLDNLTKLVSGSTVFLLFDKDIHTNLKVKQELQLLGVALEKLGCKVSVVEIPLEGPDKGIDDVLVNQGPEAVHSLIESRLSFSDWSQATDEILKDKSASAMAKLFCKLHGKQIKYRASFDEFYMWDSTLGYYQQLGAWNDDEKGQVENSVTMEDLVVNALDNEIERKCYDDNFVKQVVKMLKKSGYLKVSKWVVPKGILPCLNGHLDLETKRLLPASPLRLVTDKPAVFYNPQAECPTWDKHLDWLFNGDEGAKKVLECAYIATLRKMSHLQKYINIVGAPGSGKSTILVVLRRLLGQGNWIPGTVQRIENDRFYMYNAIEKMAIIVADAERYEGSATSLKILTGQDPVYLEAKNKQPEASGKVFAGLLWIISNWNIGFKDGSGAVFRRRIILRADQVVAEKDVDPELPLKLEAETSGILNRLLSYSDEDIANYLTKTSQFAPTVYKWNVEAEAEISPIAAWAKFNLVYEPGARVQLGTKQTDDNGELKNIDSWLFPNYLKWCSEHNTKETTKTKTFEDDLMSHLNSKLKLEVVIKRPSNKVTLYNVRLRTPNESTCLIDGSPFEDDLELRKPEAVEPTESTVEAAIRLLNETPADNIHMIFEVVQSHLIGQPSEKWSEVVDRVKPDMQAVLMCMAEDSFDIGSLKCRIVLPFAGSISVSHERKAGE